MYAFPKAQSFLAVAIVALGTFLTLAETAVAGAWTQPVGKSYLRTSVSFYHADEYYDEFGKKQPGDWWEPTSKFSSTQLTQIVEYGLRDDVTLLFDGVYKSLYADRSQADRSDDSVFGLGDVGVGLRRRVVSSKYLISLQGRFELPGGYTGGRQDYALGNGEVNFDGRIQLGGGLGSFTPNWFNLEAGYRIRGGAFADDITFGGAVGIQAVNRVWIRAGAGGIRNLQKMQTVDPDDPEQGDPTRSASYVSAGAALTVVLSRVVNLELQYSGEVMGENSFHGRGFEITVEMRR